MTREIIELKVRLNKAVRRHDLVRHELDVLRERLLIILEDYGMPKQVRTSLENAYSQSAIEDPDDGETALAARSR